MILHQAISLGTLKNGNTCHHGDLQLILEGFPVASQKPYCRGTILSGRGHLGRENKVLSPFSLSLPHGA